METRLKGLYAAPYTPMKPGGGVHTGGVEKLAAALKDQGVSGAFVNGTTGESMSLTVAERKHLAEGWMAQSSEEFRVILHVGHQSLGDARDLAAHAQSIGAFGIACVSPCYYRPQTLRDLVDFTTAVAEAAPETDFYYYHIPSMTNVSFPVSDYFSLAGGQIPTLRGAKFSHSDLADLAACVAFGGGRYDMLFGKDEMMLPALALGTRAFVGSTFNFAAPIYLRIIEAYQAGDIKTAREEQLRAVRMIEILDQHRGAVAGKALMKLTGLDCGPARLPQRTLSDEETKSLQEELDRAGCFGFIPRDALSGSAA